MRWPTTLVALVSASFFAGTSSNAQHCERPVVRVSDAANGEQGNLNSFRGDASSKGRYVAFESVASNLLSGDDNDEHDVFWRNMETAELRLLSINLVGEFANYRSRSVSLNCDGTIAEFTSLSSDLVEGDTNERRDIFVRDIQNEITQRVSVSSAGVQSNGSSDAARISGGGHHVAFASWGSNLVPDDTNNLRDAFVHDLLTGVTTRISVSTHGEQGNLYSYNPSLSFDGHYVAFESIATNLIPGDTNSAPDIFMHDRETGETTRVSVSAEGEQGNGWSRRPAISGDGAFVTFESNASTLVPGDTNGVYDVFVVQWQADPTVVERVSVSSTGEQGNGPSERPDISEDGRMVLFRSHATNLVPGGASGQGDFYVHDRWTGVTRMVSTTEHGEWANGWSPSARISCDGDYVAFTTVASNIVPGDTNGWQDVFLRALDVPPLTPGDVDCDGDVDPFDLALLLGNWGPCPGPCTPGDPPTCLADFDHDCTVGPFDLAFLLGNWGP